MSVSPSGPVSAIEVFKRLAKANANKLRLQELYVELEQARQKRTQEESEHKGNWFTNLSLQKIEQEIQRLISENRSSFFLLKGDKVGQGRHAPRSPDTDEPTESGVGQRKED